MTRRRRRVAVVVAPLVGLAGAVAAAASFLASRVVGVRRGRRFPHRLLAVGEATVTLARNEETERPGIYGLATPSAHAVMGEIVSATPDEVVRAVVHVDHGQLAPGRAALDHVHVGDPESAHRMDHKVLELSGEAGPLPAWVLHGGDTWVIVAHGLGGTRASSLSFLPMLRDAGHSVLVASYRNDPGAGSSRDGRYHLGDEEWHDIDVAMSYALANGARRLVLFGWSLGGAVVLQALTRSPRAGAVVGVVLDSPVLDWRRVLRHVGRRQRVPGPLVSLATWVVERRIDIDLDRFDWLERAHELTVPVLVFHGETDATVPFSPSAALAEARSDLVELVVVPGAGHVGSWNVDPEAYAARVTGFLAGLADRATSPRETAATID